MARGRHRRAAWVVHRGRHRKRFQASRLAGPAIGVGTLGTLTALTATAIVQGAGAGAAPPQRVADTLGLPSPAPFSAQPYIYGIDPPTPRATKPALPPADISPSLAALGPLPSDALGIPRVALAAYVAAARGANATHPGCNLPWQLLAAIGYIESDHARSGGSADPHWNGVANPPILGPILDGHAGVGTIPDTDHGLLDGNAQWDRAVGPMQFIPSTWAMYRVDGNHDGNADPQNIWDATLAAGDYLCTAATGLDQPANEVQAVFSYNHSADYVRTVLGVMAGYAGTDPALLDLGTLPPAVAETPSPSPTPTASRSRPAVEPSVSRSPSATPTPTPSATESESATPSPTETAAVVTESPTPTGTPTL